jgi:hypothetical protein
MLDEPLLANVGRETLRCGEVPQLGTHVSMRASFLATKAGSVTVGDAASGKA